MLNLESFDNSYTNDDGVLLVKCRLCLNSYRHLEPTYHAFQADTCSTFPMKLPPKLGEVDIFILYSLYGSKYEWKIFNISKHSNRLFRTLSKPIDLFGFVICDACLDELKAISAIKICGEFTYEVDPKRAYNKLQMRFTTVHEDSKGLVRERSNSIVRRERYMNAKETQSDEYCKMQ